MGKFIDQLRRLDTPHPLLKLDRQQWYVRLLRRCLAETGHGDAAWGKASNDVSDVYDKDLKARVSKFQADAGIGVDGVCGDDTWTALCSFGGTAATPKGGMRGRLIATLDDTKLQRRVWDRARDILPTNGARCAITSSLWLNYADIFPEQHTLTRGVEKLIRRIPGHRYITDSSKLMPGDIAFTKDLNQLPMPDHMYIIHQPVNSAKASVLDNYSIKPHGRNLTGGPRTPFEYAIRLPS
jgi:hypothetical protein